MRPSRLILLALLVLTGACGRGADADEGGTILQYSYRPGETLSYELELVTAMTSESTDGASTSAAADWAMDMGITERLELAFAEGADPATIRITMTQEVLDGEAHTSTLGQEQSIPLEQFTAGLQNEVSVVIDARGKLLSASIGGSELPAQFLTALSSFSGSTMLQPQQLGPEFPAEPVSVGDEWQTTASTEILGLQIAQTSRHRLAAEEQLLGRRTYRIESLITTERYSADLADLMTVLQETPGLLGGADPAQMDAAFGQFEDSGIDLEFDMAESTASLTTWFDPVAGIVVRSELRVPIAMTMRMGALPEGGESSMHIEMATDQQMTLVE